MRHYDYSVKDLVNQRAQLDTSIDKILNSQEEVACAVARASGIKHDSGKPRMELLSTIWLRGVAAVLTFGAKKYAADNWRKGLERRRLIGAAMRHITAYNDGQDLDPETGLSHLDHASCCLMFARELHETMPSTDDRFKR